MQLGGQPRAGGRQLVWGASYWLVWAAARLLPTLTWFCRPPLCVCLLHVAQGVALAARTLGCKAVICMPTNSPEIKVNAVKELGGIVELVGESFYEVSRLGEQK